MTGESIKVLPIEELDAQARQHVLALLGDGQWQKVEELRRRMPADLVAGRLLHLPNPALHDNPLGYGQFLLVDAVLASLKAEGYIECGTVGGQSEVRLGSAALAKGIGPAEGGDKQAQRPTMYLERRRLFRLPVKRPRRTRPPRARPRRPTRRTRWLTCLLMVR